MPEWVLTPGELLALLPMHSAPCLQRGQPLASSGVSMVVQLALGKVPVRRGSTAQQRNQDILTLLVREGLQRPNSTQRFAVLHQTSKQGDTVAMLVGQDADSQAAAQAAVTAGYICVGPFTVPISWARSTMPAGCTEVTVHQLPVEWVRRGCGTALLEAAGQQGEVVCEFLGGSSWMGDADLSCPAADAVVIWVRYPADDPLLTKLPSGFQVPGRARVQVNVGGRPSLAPETWQQLTQRRLHRQHSAYAAVLGAATAASRPQAEQRQQQQQHGRQQQQEQPLQQQQGRRQQEQQQEQPLQQQQHHHNTARTAQQQQDVEMSPADVMGSAEAPTNSQHATEQRQQQQAMTGQGQASMQQDADMETDEEIHIAAPAAGTSGAARAAAGARFPGDPAEVLPNDPFGARHSSTVWERLQQEQMLQDATELIGDEAEDPAELRLSDQDKQRLQAAFRKEFAAQLQQQECPAEQQVRAWLRQQLGIAQLSYDDGSDDDAAPYGDQHAQGAASGSQQQQQRRQQRQQPHSGMAADASRQRATCSNQGLRDQQGGDGVRRSGRNSKGQVSFDYAALFGTSTQKHQAAAAAAAGGTGGGKGGDYEGAHQQRRQQEHQQLHQPLTPAAPAPPPRKGKRGGGK